MYSFYFSVAILTALSLSLTLSQTLKFLSSKKLSKIATIVSIALYVLLIVFYIWSSQVSGNQVILMIFGLIFALNILFGVCITVYIFIKVGPKIKKDKESKEIAFDVLIYIILIGLSLLILLDNDTFIFSYPGVVPVPIQESGSIFSFMFIVIVLSLTTGLLAYSFSKITYANTLSSKYRSISIKEYSIIAIISLLIALIIIVDRDISIYSDATRERYYELVDILKVIVLGLVVNAFSIFYKERLQQKKSIIHEDKTS